MLTVPGVERGCLCLHRIADISGSCAARLVTALRHRPKEAARHRNCPGLLSERVELHIRKADAEWSKLDLIHHGDSLCFSTTFCISLQVVRLGYQAT